MDMMKSRYRLRVKLCLCLFFFKQKTAYEMRISDWSSDVCSSDLIGRGVCAFRLSRRHGLRQRRSNLCLSGGLRVCRGPAERTSRAEHQPNFDAVFHIVPLPPSLFFASWLAAL